MTNCVTKCLSRVYLKRLKQERLQTILFLHWSCEYGQLFSTASTHHTHSVQSNCMNHIQNQSITILDVHHSHKDTWAASEQFHLVVRILLITFYNSGNPWSIILHLTFNFLKTFELLCLIRVCWIIRFFRNIHFSSDCNWCACLFNCNLHLYYLEKRQWNWKTKLKTVLEYYLRCQKPNGQNASNNINSNLMLTNTFLGAKVIWYDY